MKRCWVIAFLLPGVIIKLFGPVAIKLIDNHLHKTLRHLPEAFEEGTLLEISCESFEAFISKLIKINTNNQEIYTTFRLLEKSYEEQPKLTIPNGNRSENKTYRSKWLKTYKIITQTGSRRTIFS